MGPTFRTLILELMPNVISKIKQNSSDMNEIILDTLRCRLCSKLYWFLLLQLTILMMRATNIKARRARGG
jgi:hypothetical protein